MVDVAQQAGKGGAFPIQKAPRPGTPQTAIQQAMINVVQTIWWFVEPVFDPIFPASSPYVTTVGATQLRIKNGVGKTGMLEEPEHTVTPGAYGFSSGGGFSMFTPRPWYQDHAVNHFLRAHNSTLPPSFAFNAQGRAYPDVAMNGHNFVLATGLIFNLLKMLDLGAGGLLGDLIVEQGTSASSPTLAGMISLINSHLLENNQPPLGFLNPLFYKLAKEQPASFNDILPFTYENTPLLFTDASHNNCSRVTCCEWGFSATPGWDPTSGLGTPDWTVLFDYITGTN